VFSLQRFQSPEFHKEGAMLEKYKLVPHDVTHFGWIWDRRFSDSSNHPVTERKMAQHLAPRIGIPNQKSQIINPAPS
jgi:hypothetical protein